MNDFHKIITFFIEYTRHSPVDFCFALNIECLTHTVVTVLLHHEILLMKSYITSFNPNHQYIISVH